MLELSCTI